MHNRILKKLACMCLSAAMLLAITACSKNETAREAQKTTGSANEIVDVQNQIEDLAKQNAAAEAGAYVTPAEACFTWETAEGGVSVTGYSGEDQAIRIPDTLNGAPVVKVASGAFSNTQVLGVQLADSVTELEEMAFYYCTTLLEVKFGAHLKTVGDECFEGCIALSKVEFNHELEAIGYAAFGYCTLLKTAVLPSSLKVLERGAFCLSGLEEIEVPGSVEAVGEQAFASCSGLKSVTIGDGVQKLDSEVFRSCEALVEIYLPASVQEIESNVFLRCANVTIYAPAGSQAEAYAGKNGIPFQAT